MINFDKNLKGTPLLINKIIYKIDRYRVNCFFSQFIKKLNIMVKSNVHDFCSKKQRKINGHNIGVARGGDLWVTYRQPFCNKQYYMC